MKTTKLSMLTIAGACLVVVILMVSFLLFAKPPSTVKETSGVSDLSGNNLAATRISDFKELNTLPFAMYSPGQFVKPGAMPGVLDNEERISLDGKPRDDKRGTYRFIFLNLDPNDENFVDNAAALSPYLKGDNAWHFTLHVPAVWSACTVYVNTALIETVGELIDYNFTDYTNYIGETVYHKSKTEPLYIDLSFYSKRANMSPTKHIISAQIVTIHFETAVERSSGMSGVPIVGEDSAVRGYVNQEKSALALTAFIAAMALAVFGFLCFLKRTLSFLPQLVVVMGVFGALISGYMLTIASTIPYVWAVLGNLFVFSIPLATMLSFRLKIRKFPIWIPFVGVSLINCLAMSISPILPAAAQLGIIVWEVTAAVSVVVIMAVLVSIAVWRKKANIVSIISTVFAAALPLSMLFEGAQIVMLKPSFWIMVGILTVSIGFSFHTFHELERKNRLLTTNLQGEVARQTDDLQCMIAERDKLLRHVSHDMKKPLQSIERFLSTLRERESDVEQIKTIGIIDQKTEELIKGFDELCGYAKLNYTVETSQDFDVAGVIDKCYKALNPDCIASGVIFNIATPSIVVYGKQECLESVLKNIIINALEHSACESITITAYKRKGFCHVKVTDDGIGVDETKDLFQPYYSDNDDGDNVGLGLYICKSLMTAMGGDLSYAMKDGKLTFTATVPLL